MNTTEDEDGNADQVENDEDTDDDDEVEEDDNDEEEEKEEDSEEEEVEEEEVDEDNDDDEEEDDEEEGEEDDDEESTVDEDSLNAPKTKSSDSSSSNEVSRTKLAAPKKSNMHALVWRRADVKTLFSKHRMFPAWVGAVIDPNNTNKGYMPVALWNEQAMKLKAKSDGFYDKIMSDSSSSRLVEVGNNSDKALSNSNSNSNSNTDSDNRGTKRSREDKDSNNDNTLDDDDNNFDYESDDNEEGGVSGNSEEEESDNEDSSNEDNQSGEGSDFNSDVGDDEFEEEDEEEESRVPAKRARVGDQQLQQSPPMFLGSLFNSISYFVGTISSSFVNFFTWKTLAPTRTIQGGESDHHDSFDVDSNESDDDDISSSISSSSSISTSSNSGPNKLMLKSGKINAKNMRSLAFNSISSSYSVLTTSKSEVVIGPGDNYGGDFTVYEGENGPLSNHASMTIRVTYDDLLSISDFISFTRVQNQVAKSAIYIFPNKKRILSGVESSETVESEKYENFDNALLVELQSAQSKLVSFLTSKGFKVNPDKGRRRIEKQLEQRNKDAVIIDDGDDEVSSVKKTNFSAAAEEAEFFSIDLTDQETLINSNSNSNKNSGLMNFVAATDGPISFENRLQKLATDSFHRISVNDLKIAFNFKDVSIRG